ncbi:MAG: DUF1566 domain-containing protein [Desulfosalsimonas sp.]|uniref:Lcl domain-containing protein n=1 Tax=Desulfosalsimonas sp. TaxID=3073848 RepID=UPI0039709502
MERENFYLLLELPCDPPETDVRVIEDAIAKKQSEWSRLRNHPTKGLHAQKCINLIPEIRRVMTDEALRAKEAEAAREISAKDKQDKYPEIDRHIDILMGKGHITPEEAHKLSKVHGLDQGEIQGRIAARKNQKYNRVDQQITLRMAKGFLTESEVEQIAKRNSVKVDEVRKRVRCPIKKNGGDKDITPPRQLDRSLEKTIRDKLKLLNKSSLYDFLDLPESADLQTLQEAASQKKKQVARASKKDAVATANNTLAGHCMTLFKSNETRNAYDVSLARAKLAELDSDIDIAGINGKIRPEYYDILIQKGIEFGMEKHEAEQYIRDYCRRKKWSIETAPKKRRRMLMTAGAAVIAVVLLVTAGMIVYNIQQDRARQADFDRLIRRVEDKSGPSEKIDLLEKFLQAHAGDENYTRFTDAVRKRIDKLAGRAAQLRYDETADEIQALEQQDKYEQAIDRLDRYLQSSPPKKQADKARKKITNLEDQIEKKNFQALEDLMLSGSTKEKMKAIDRYLEKYPNSTHREAVRSMEADMSGEYYIYVQNALERCESDQDWKACADLCRDYLDRYDNSYADQLKDRLAEYREKIKQARRLAALEKKARQHGTDYDKAIDVYKDFLTAYPDSPLAEKAKNEISRLREIKKDRKAQSTRQRFRSLLAQSSDRFTEKRRGVVTDSRTGLMWQLLDSAMAGESQCLTYEEAGEYVENSETGGYTDWRLPTAEELAVIYKEPPYFPVMEEKWYWTADSYSSYSDGWRRIVDTIDNQPGSDWRVERRDSKQCGAVRAVRKP